MAEARPEDLRICPLTDRICDERCAWRIRYTTIKIPKKYRRSIDLIWAEIVKNSDYANKLLELLREDECPICNTKLKSVEFNLKHVELMECPSCGYSKPVLRGTIEKDEIPSVFNVGVIAALGIHLIAKMLGKRL